jgi:signal transduction histidine kinase
MSSVQVDGLRRRFVWRACGLGLALVLGCTGVVRMVGLGPDGVVLGIFLAAAIVILTIRVLSGIWSKSVLELLEQLRASLGVVSQTQNEGNIKEEIGDFCGRLAFMTEGSRHEQEQRRRLVADVFHAVGQPLTALRCVLEVALRTPKSAEQYRKRLEDALGQAERMARLTVQFRRLAHAIDFDDQGKSCRFDESLESAREEIAALAEIRQIQMSIVAAPAVMVPGERQRLSEALFYILEFSVDCAPPQTEVVARSEIRREGLIFTVTSKVVNGKGVTCAADVVPLEVESANPDSTFGLRIAEHIVEKLGGRLDRELRAGSQVLRATIPVLQILLEKSVAEHCVGSVT